MTKMMLLLLLPVKLQKVMKNFAASMLRLQELKSIFIYLFQETLIAMVVRFTDPLLTILIMAKIFTIHAVKQKKGGGSPQCHLVKTLADRPPLFSLANKNIKRPSFRAHQRLYGPFHTHELYLRQIQSSNLLNLQFLLWIYFSHTYL